MRALTFALIVLAGCGAQVSTDSAAVHIDKLREQVNSLTRERDALSEKLAASELKYDELMLAMSRFKEAAVKEPALAVGRYLRALRRQKFDHALQHPEADLTIKPHLQSPGDKVAFLSFARNVHDAGGEVPEGISSKFDLSGFSGIDTEEVDELLSLDKAIAKASNEDEIDMIYYDREMKRLGKFADGIVSQ